MTRTITATLVSLGAGICGSVITCAAQAQEAGRPASAETVIEEIIVTAQRRAQNIRDDPRFQEILALDAAHRAEQLELLRERHRIPPPWSPDYFPSE